MNAVFLLALCLLTPMLLLIVWAVTNRAATESANAKIALATLIVCAAGASATYRSLSATHLDQSAALFIGIPTILALAAVFSPSPRSAIGAACKAVTIGMLMSAVFLWEGFLCIAMSAPLFYLVAIVVGFIVGKMGAKTTDTESRVFSLVALMAFVPMSLEGVVPLTSFERSSEVTVTRTIQASAAEIGRAVASTPRFDRTLPRYLRAGFPRPIDVRIGEPAAGSQWVIRFRGGETRLNGQENADGDLVLEVSDARPGLLAWRAVSDSSHMTHFLEWQEARVEWRAIDEGTTEVTWTLRYRRSLDPAWYFGPMERYAVTLAAGYLIDSVATP